MKLSVAPCSSEPVSLMPLDPVNISEVIVHGIVFDPKNSEALRSMDLNKLLEAIPRLFGMMDERRIDYVLVGGIAMLVYVEGRNTQDIDLIVAADSLEAMPELRVEVCDPDFARAWLDDLRVDFLFTRNRLFDKVRRDHVTKRRFVECEIPCATVEGLLLLKLFALPSLYRQARFDRVETYERDVTMLIRDYQPSIEPLFDELARHMIASDLEEIRAIVADINQRIERSRQRFHNGESPS